MSKKMSKKVKQKREKKEKVLLTSSLDASVFLPVLMMLLMLTRLMFAFIASEKEDLEEENICTLFTRPGFMAVGLADVEVDAI